MGWGSRPALLIIDVCTAYWVPCSPLSLLDNPGAVTVPDSIRRLLASARKGNVPAIWSTVKYKDPDMADAGLFWRKSKSFGCVEGGGREGTSGVCGGVGAGEGRYGSGEKEWKEVN
jgi:hypothetical protein